MPHTQTPNDQAETLSDSQFLNQLGDAVAELSKGVAMLLETANLLLDARELDRKQLDHVDSMIHELVRFVDEHRPALSRALAFLEPGKGIRDYLKNRPRP